MPSLLHVGGTLSGPRPAALRLLSPVANLVLLWDKSIRDEGANQRNKKVSAAAPSS